jgi:putrescine aminotransferase
MTGSSDTYLWHSQAHMPSVRGRELVLVRGEGAYVWDADGRKLLDVPGSLWYANIGHGRAEIAEAVAAQMRILEAYSTFGRYATPPALELAERVALLAPVANARVFFTSGGGEAIDTAAKLAQRYWSAQGKPEKRTIVSRESAYHGLFGWGTSITGLELLREGLGGPMPDTARVPANDAAALADLLERDRDRIAAFFCEPVIGTGGVIPPADGYLETAQELCRAHDVLLVVDEVITGFGRTGWMFASERFGLEPDILIVAKGITSGYLPLGAALVAERVWGPFWEEGSALVFRHGITYSGHAAACAAALANLDIVEGEGLVERVRRLEPALDRAVQSLAGHPLVADVRSGVGLLAGLQLRDAATAERVAERCYERGLLSRILIGTTLQLSPPFVIEESELETMRDALRDALDAA